MRIDQTHRKWFAASLIIFGVATAIYVPYAANSPSGPRGGSSIGLMFGIVGSGFMVFSGLLAARKKAPVWRVGRAQSWMRGHLWLGLLSLPIIFFHAGFKFGGPLTSVLMWLLIVVVVSGVFGAALQHYLPHVMTVQVPGETIFEQIDHVREQLIAEADRLVTVTSIISEFTQASHQRRSVLAMDKALAVEDGTGPLQGFYEREMKPFLLSRFKRHQLLSNADRAHSAFEGLRTLLPLEAHEVTKRLEAICDEERQLRHQSLLHHWLHGWLLLHVPMSFALLLLGCVHAIAALRY